MSIIRPQATIVRDILAHNNCSFTGDLLAKFRDTSHIVETYMSDAEIHNSLNHITNKGAISEGNGAMSLYSILYSASSLNDLIISLTKEKGSGLKIAEEVLAIDRYFSYGGKALENVKSGFIPLFKRLVSEFNIKAHELTPTSMNIDPEIVSVMNMNTSCIRSEIRKMDIPVAIYVYGRSMSHFRDDLLQDNAMKKSIDFLTFDDVTRIFHLLADIKNKKETYNGFVMWPELLLVVDEDDQPYFYSQFFDINEFLDVMGINLDELANPKNESTYKIAELRPDMIAVLSEIINNTDPTKVKKLTMVSDKALEFWMDHHIDLTPFMSIEQATKKGKHHILSRGLGI